MTIVHEIYNLITESIMDDNELNYPCNFYIEYNERYVTIEVLSNNFFMIMFLILIKPQVKGINTVIL